MDYRFAEASDIAALVAAPGIYLAGDVAASQDSRESLWWERMGDDRRTVIFEDDGEFVAHIVYRPADPGFDLEEFVVDGGGLIAAEAFRLLLDEIVAPGIRIVVAQPSSTPEAVAFWRSQGFEADRVSLAWIGTPRRAAANEN
jgi:uncharacterized protein YkuJ